MMDPADPMAVTLAGREAIERRKNLRSAARAVGEQFTDEERRYLIRACLRGLEEEREALEFVTEMFGVDSITTPDSRDKVERLRSLLPETEGEA